MKFKSGAIAVLTLATSVCGSNVILAQGPPPSGYRAEGGWDIPPSEYQEVGRRAITMASKVPARTSKITAGPT